MWPIGLDPRNPVQILSLSPALTTSWVCFSKSSVQLTRLQFIAKWFVLPVGIKLSDEFI